MMRINYFQIIERISSSIDEYKVYDLPVDLKTIITGGELSFKIPVIKECDKCNGTGIEDNGDECVVCQGTGRISKVMKTNFATIVEQITCPRCLGSGRVNVKYCTKCNGSGRVRTYEKITIRVERGTVNDELILIRKRDQFNPTIYGRIKIFDEFFQVDGNDIIAEIKIKVDDIIEKKDKIIEIPYPNETLKFSIKELVEKEKLIILGKGLESRDGTRGNLIIVTKITH